MSKTQRGFLMASIFIALGVALVTWAMSAPKKYEEPEFSSQYFYKPPDLQPNCYSEEGCARETRLPDWLQKHLGIEERQAATHQDEYNQQLSHAAVISVFYGILIGGILYGLMAGLHYFYRSFIKQETPLQRRSIA